MASSQVLAKFPYKGGERENFVSFNAGDRFTLLSKDDDGWWRVRNNKNEEMYVPATYVEIVDESAVTDSKNDMTDNRQDNETRESSSEPVGIPVPTTKSDNSEAVDDVCFPPPPDSFFKSSFVCESPINSLPPPPDESVALPKGWTELTSADGDKYYYNEETSLTQWEKPASVSVELSPVMPRATKRTRMKLEWIRDAVDGEVVYTHPLTGEKWMECNDSQRTYFYCVEDTTRREWTLPEIRVSAKINLDLQDRKRASTHSDTSPRLLRVSSLGSPSTRARATSDIQKLSETDISKLAFNLEVNVPKAPTKHKKGPAPAPPKGHKRGSSHPVPNHPGLKAPVARSASETDSKEEESRASSEVPLLGEKDLGMEGPLSRKKLVDASGKKCNQRNWSQHFVILETPYLLFFKDKKHAKDQRSGKMTLPGTLCLQNCQLSLPEYKKKCVIQLTSGVGEQMYLQADNSKDLTEWVGAIKNGMTYADSLPTLKMPVNRKYSTPNADEDFFIDDIADVVEKKGKIKARLRTFLSRRPTYEDVSSKGLIKETVFGAHLSHLVEREKGCIPKFVVLCIEAIERRGLHHVGLYRVSGNASQIQKLRFKVDREEPLDLNDRRKWEDINVLAGALKLFFRELPDPLLPSCQFPVFVKIIAMHDPAMKLAAARRELVGMPKANKETLKYLMEHLERVVAKGSENKMQIQNLAIVFGPTLLRSDDPGNIAANMAYQNAIVDFLLKEYDELFG
eukprot:m.2259 g.2259  ORF g.2259 m.2259 type:complete len:739 (+) comp8524_c0_seq1:172-2388(+)